MADENEAPVCSVCQKKNEPEAAVCAWCGSPLISTTFEVPELGEDLAKPPSTQDLKDQNNLLIGTLAIYVGGVPRPIIIQSKGKIVLGRYTPDAPPPTVDLSQYNAQRRGVSRRHAAIKLSYGKWMLEDLGSTNGTWLNDNQLSPHDPQALQNGDQIRLGQLVIFVYFSR